jgi:hypothetical protein
MAALAVMTHYSLVVNTILEEKTIQKFWWQVSWRAPSIQPGTLLVIHYPASSIGDDGFGVMEAPNLIYFPEASVTAEGFVHYSLAALTGGDQSVKDILVGKRYRNRLPHHDHGSSLTRLKASHSSAHRNTRSQFSSARISCCAATPSIVCGWTNAYRLHSHGSSRNKVGVSKPSCHRKRTGRAASFGDEAPLKLILGPAGWMLRQAYALGDEKKLNLDPIGIDDFVRSNL